jgi:primase-polymerase (primpol)-like protein
MGVLAHGTWQKIRQNSQSALQPAHRYKASASNPAIWGTLAQALACAEKYQYRD